MKRTIEFTVGSDGSVSPAIPQYGGVKGEHKMTTVVFHIPKASITGTTTTCRIVFTAGDGGVLSSDLLTLTGFSEDTKTANLEYSLPKLLTMHGGQLCMHVEIANFDENDNEISCSKTGEAVLYFDDAAVENGTPFWTGVSEMLKRTTTAKDTAVAAQEQAVTSAETATNAAEQATASAASAQEAKETAVTAKEQAAASADTAAGAADWASAAAALATEQASTAQTAAQTATDAATAADEAANTATEQAASAQESAAQASDASKALDFACFGNADGVATADGQWGWKSSIDNLLLSSEKIYKVTVTAPTEGVAGETRFLYEDGTAEKIADLLVTPGATKEYTFTPASTASHVALQHYFDGSGSYRVTATVEDVTHLNARLTEAEEQQGMIDERLTVIEEQSAPTVLLEQGGLKFADGSEVEASYYIRTAAWLPYEGVYKYAVNDGYTVNVYYYDADKAFITYRQIADATSYELPYNTAYKYVRFAIKRIDGADMGVDEDTGFTVYGAKEHFHTLSTAVDYCGQEDIVRAVFNSTQHFPVTQGFYCVTDMHGYFTPLDDVCALRTLTGKSYPILNAGDNSYYRPKENGEWDTGVNEYMARAIANGVYHAIGQHDCGYSDDETGKAKVNCLSHEDVFATYIEPMKEVWGLPDLTTNYYYKDFDGVRLIVLYPYNVPLVDDETDSTLYKYHRADVWYGEDQLDWFADTLASTPEGYGVVVMMHQPEKTVMQDENNTAFFSKIGTAASYIIDGYPITDIVEAFINRGAINKTYTCTNTEKYPTDTFSMAIDTDFSEAKGVFLSYITGDVHFDHVGKVNGTNQVDIGLTSSSIPDDAVVVKNGDFVNRSAVNALAYNVDEKTARLGRLGQSYYSTGQKRELTKITL